MKLKYEQSSVIFYNGTIAKIYVGFVNIQKKQKEILAKIDLTAFKFFHIIKFIWHIIYATLRNTLSSYHQCCFIKGQRSKSHIQGLYWFRRGL